MSQTSCLYNPAAPSFSADTLSNNNRWRAPEVHGKLGGAESISYFHNKVRSQGDIILDNNSLYLGLLIRRGGRHHGPSGSPELEAEFLYVFFVEPALELVSRATGGRCIRGLRLR